MAEKEAAKPAEEKKGSPVMSILFSVASAAIMAGVAAGVVMFAPSKPVAQCAAVDADSHSEEEDEHIEEVVIRDYSDAVFVNLEPLVVSLGENARSDYLKISISLETSADYEYDVDHLRPKFRDILNTYLRAVDENDLIEPAAMMHLRAQLLRRLQLVATADAVKDVLITDFVLN